MSKRPTRQNKLPPVYSGLESDLRTKQQTNSLNPFLRSQVAQGLITLSVALTRQNTINMSQNGADAAQQQQDAVVAQQQQAAAAAQAQLDAAAALQQPPPQLPLQPQPQPQQQQQPHNIQPYGWVPHASPPPAGAVIHLNPPIAPNIDPVTSRLASIATLLQNLTNTVNLINLNQQAQQQQLDQHQQDLNDAALLRVTPLPSHSSPHTVILDSELDEMPPRNLQPQTNHKVTHHHHSAVAKATKPLPVFHGNVDSDVEDFLNAFSTRAHACHWSVKEKLDNLLLCFDSEALRWWARYKTVNHIRDSDEINDAESHSRYENVIQALRTEFRPANYSVYIKQRLDQRRMRHGENIRTLYTDVLDLCYRYDSNMVDAQKINYLNDSLKSNPPLHREMARHSANPFVTTAPTPIAWLTAAQAAVEYLQGDIYLDRTNINYYRNHTNRQNISSNQNQPAPTIVYNTVESTTQRPRQPAQSNNYKLNNNPFVRNPQLNTNNNSWRNRPVQTLTYGRTNQPFSPTQSNNYRERRTTQGELWCDFHKIAGHSTAQCKAKNNQIVNAFEVLPKTEVINEYPEKIFQQNGLPYIMTHCKGVTLKTLVDTGAGISVITKEAVDKLHVKTFSKPILLRTLENNQISSTESIKESFQIGKLSADLNLCVVSHLNGPHCDAIFGLDSLSKFNVVIDCTTPSITIKHPITTEVKVSENVIIPARSQSVIAVSLKQPTNHDSVITADDSVMKTYNIKSAPSLIKNGTTGHLLLMNTSNNDAAIPKNKVIGFAEETETHLVNVLSQNDSSIITTQLGKSPDLSYVPALLRQKTGVRSKPEITDKMFEEEIWSLVQVNPDLSSDESRQLRDLL